ncbi:MAG: glycosyltransferase involved in cell wall biosynthesis [Myxococcota bacterium]
MSSPPRYCIVVPTYDNPATIRGVIERLLAQPKRLFEMVIVVDDGSGPAGRAACEDLANDGLAMVHHRETNGGKGAGVCTGLKVAQSIGFTHAIQIDADGQHDIARLGAFVAASRESPEALVLGYPKYDESAPKVRKIARKFTQFWVDIEAGRGTISDAMVGFRVYPVDVTLALPVRGRRMDFDIEVAVRAARARIPIVNLEVEVRYLTTEEGGVSHFQPLWDNLRFAWLHSRLCTEGCVGWVMRKVFRRRQLSD